MEIKELLIKPESELKHLILDLKKKLDELNFKAQQKQLKNIREIRVVKKDIAQIFTVLKQKAKK